MMPRTARRSTGVFLALGCASLTSGCGPGPPLIPWWERVEAPTPIFGDPHPGDAVGILFFAGVGLVIQAGVETVRAVADWTRHWDFGGQPGVAYDSREGRALRIPNYPVQ